VLVIDDERDIRTAMSALLKSWDCEPVVAASVQDAIRAWNDAPGAPDLVLCDYRLPGGLTGADALTALEAHWRVPLISVIITGDTSPERIREAKSFGRPVLFKPVIPGKLRALLSALRAQR
jgi:CheY-like chemotaxis protein